MSYLKDGKPVIDGCMDSPAFHRNHTYIVDVIKSELNNNGGDVLEIASGSGQHALVYADALPHHVIWPSDFNSECIQSIAAWRSYEGKKNISVPFALDVSAKNWGLNAAGRPCDGLAAIISINMVHISPIAAAEGLFRGAGRYLGDGGKLFLYGPFKKNGVHTAPSNEEFDDWLRASNAEWGVRDLNELKTLAITSGLVFGRAASMPSNNFMLIFCKGK